MSELEVDKLGDLLKGVVLSTPKEGKRRKPKLLYMDLLNFGGNFFLISDWNVRKAFIKVENFVSAARNSGFHLKVFLDGVRAGEAEMKWKTRREKEILKGEKNMPQGFAHMLGEMFADCGIQTMYSVELDCDTTLAYFAHADGADVLSDDKDLFRYTGASYIVYNEYEIKNNQLFIFPKPPYTGSIPLKPIPLGPKPAVSSSILFLERDGIFQRGVVTPLVRTLNIDVYKIITPLIHARLASQNIRGPITESWPFWDDEKQEVSWHRKIVPIVETSPECLRLLKDPEAAFEYFFPGISEDARPSYIASKLWKRHVFGLRCVVYDICSHETSFPLYRLMMNYQAARKGQTAPLSSAPQKRNESNPEQRLPRTPHSQPRQQGGESWRRSQQPSTAPQQNHPQQQQQQQRQSQSSQEGRLERGDSAVVSSTTSQQPPAARPSSAPQKNNQQRQQQKKKQQQRRPPAPAPAPARGQQQKPTQPAQPAASSSATNQPPSTAPPQKTNQQQRPPQQSSNGIQQGDSAAPPSSTAPKKNRQRNQQKKQQRPSQQSQGQPQPTQPAASPSTAPEKLNQKPRAPHGQVDRGEFSRTQQPSTAPPSSSQPRNPQKNQPKKQQHQQQQPPKKRPPQSAPSQK